MTGLKRMMWDVGAWGALSFGVFLVVTNRMRHYLFLNLFSYSRLNLGLVSFTLGWVSLFLSPVENQKFKRKKR